MSIRRQVVALLLASSLPPLYAQSTQDLLAAFRTPPDGAKPMVRWWWFGPAVEKPEILRELQQMKADGIGGAELAFVYPEALEGNVPFLSPPMLDAVTYAQTEARKLGLRIDLTLCSGWPYGGPATTLAEAATRLRIAEVPLANNSHNIAVPKLAEGESFLYAALVNGTPTPPPVRHVPAPASPPASTWDPASAQPLPLTVHISQMSVTGPTSDKPLLALFFIQSHTKQEVKRAAVGAEGYVLDPFSHDAVATHLKSVGDPLLRAFGTTPPTAIFSDSLEAYGADWTPTLPAEFQKRRGYDLLPHLPELLAGGSPAADKVRHDYGQTLTELVDENYLTQINTWAHAHNTKFRSQTYGEPAVSFSSQRLVDLPEGEGPQWRAFSTLRWATSANHVFGNNVTSGETFTWLHSPVFRATPLDMKAEADIDFIMGENQLIFHGWPYSPPASQLPPGDPGWSLYAAAVFNDHNPWHPVMPAVTAYIARISNLLRQGQPANQVAVLLPTDDAWATFTPGTPTQSSLTAALQRLIPAPLLANILSAGYNYDFIDAAAIEKGGLGTHQIVVIPPTTRIPLATLRKLDAFAHSGGKVLAVETAPTLDANGQTSPELQKLLHVLPMVGDIASLGTALRNETTPDLKLAPDAPASTRDALGFIRRKLENGDIYFIANTSNQPIRITAQVGTQFASGEMLDPENGRHVDGIDSQAIQLDLEPYASEAFLFDQRHPPILRAKGYSGKSMESIVNGWKVTFPSLHLSIAASVPYDWTQDASTMHYSGEVVYERDAPMRSGIKTSHSRLFLQVLGGTALLGSPNAAPEEHVTRGPDGLPNPLITGTGPGMHAYFDPPIREAALVFINGKPAGALWHPPYRLDVTDLMHTGTNHIEIHVFNTALNAWSALPPRDYGPLKAKYGDRFQMQDLDRVKALPSGILGPVQLESDWTTK